MNKNEIIESLKRETEIIPDEYDGSYELLRETVRALTNANSKELDYRDLDMLLKSIQVKLTLI
ncbi:hypothetical protein [Orenia marismortui]|uniref:hypothetical protein n=1 Tax=Orenia marismortui TaxID=46469 RepID=UPI000368A2B6|nr:hypothetical protein [Orenia marismortui]